MIQGLCHSEYSSSQEQKKNRIRIRISVIGQFAPHIDLLWILNNYFLFHQVYSLILTILYYLHICITVYLFCLFDFPLQRCTILHPRHLPQNFVHAPGLQLDFFYLFFFFFVIQCSCLCEVM